MLKPTYIKPYKKSKKVIGGPNTVKLKVSETHTGNLIIEALCGIELSFQPQAYNLKNLNEKLEKETFKQANEARRIAGMPLLDEPFDLSESSSDYDDKIDLVHVLNKLCDGTSIDFGLPIKFTVKQKLKLLNPILKESNKLHDLSEFKRQKIHMYITTNDIDEPGPQNFQMHQVLNFDIEQNGYGKEFDTNPRFTFTFNLANAID